MIVEKLRRVRSHQVRCDLGCGGLADDRLELGDAFPVAIIVEKAAGLAGLEVFGGIFARFGHVARDAGAQALDIIGEQPANEYDPVPLKDLDLGRADERVGHWPVLSIWRGHQRRTRSSFQIISI